MSRPAALTNHPTSFSYQWQRCDRQGRRRGSISGATAQTYKLRLADVRHKIRVLETASNGGAGGPAASRPTGLVRFPATITLGRPNVNGTVVKLRLKCRGDRRARCSVTLKLLVGRTGVGGRRLTLRSGKTKIITLSLNTAGQRRLHQHHRLKVKLVVRQSGLLMTTRAIKFAT